MNIHIFDSQEKLNEAGARIIIGTVQMKQRAVLGLATGSTPTGIYEEIVREYNRGLVSFSKTTTFNLDEYVGLPIGHPESYRVYMQQHLFNFIDLPPDQIHIPNGSLEDTSVECKRYDERLAESGQIDLQLLGIGHNGHIGFNEPNHALLRETHTVTLREETRQANARYFKSMDDVPTQAITMGMGAIMKAKTIMLVVRGADKAEIVHKALTGLITTEIPASLLQTHPSLVVLMDAEAGRLFQS
ncbi:MAG: glucosamine-6-phosphate deaminase [Gorillibacterium sp.]|nr:glucosamine-6-phosphate deaminase [Gorillibacterium sp.]